MDRVGHRYEGMGPKRLVEGVAWGPTIMYDVFYMVMVGVSRVGRGYGREGLNRLTCLTSIRLN